MGKNCSSSQFLDSFLTWPKEITGLKMSAGHISGLRRAIIHSSAMLSLREHEQVFWQGQGSIWSQLRLEPSHLRQLEQEQGFWQDQVLVFARVPQATVAACLAEMNQWPALAGTAAVHRSALRRRAESQP